MNELLMLIDSEKDILEQLISIDNEKMKDNITYKDFLNTCHNILQTECKDILEDNLLFITEGDPYFTLAILKTTKKINSKVIIFVNQGYQALNKWLITKYKMLTGDQFHEIDFSNNYNKYLKKDYKVIPFGENELSSSVMEDFYE